MSNVESVAETNDKQSTRTRGKRGRTKSSLDRTVEESEAIIKSLGPEPELEEGRRSTRSSTKGTAAPRYTSSSSPISSPTPTKRKRREAPNKTVKGRGRPKQKAAEADETDSQEETIPVENNAKSDEKEVVANAVNSVTGDDEVDKKKDTETPDAVKEALNDSTVEKDIEKSEVAQNKEKAETTDVVDEAKNGDDTVSHDADPKDVVDKASGDSHETTDSVASNTNNGVSAEVSINASDKKE